MQESRPTFRSNMHQILTNPKIFKVVAKWLSAETHDPTERDFCALARTCRDLYEPAMDQAWKDLGNGIEEAKMAQENVLK